MQKPLTSEDVKGACRSLDAVQGVGVGRPSTGEVTFGLRPRFFEAFFGAFFAARFLAAFFGAFFAARFFAGAFFGAFFAARFFAGAFFADFFAAFFEAFFGDFAMD
jgi:hypothetical protein